MKTISETYFYTPPDNIRGDKLLLPSSEARHAHCVLRCHVGDVITVVDGSGTEYEVSIQHLLKDRLEGSILGHRKSIREPTAQIALAQALCRAAKFDTIVEKSTELGVQSLFPVITERSIRLTGTERLESRVHRWEKIAISAMKQSKRAILPQVTKPTPLKNIIASGQEYDLLLVAGGRERMQGIRDVVRRVGRVKSAMILVGPEGGFSSDEVERTLAAGFFPVSLGRRRLRSETAGPLAVSLVLYELGELGRP